MSNRDEIGKVGKEIREYETVTGAKINRDKLGTWKVVSLPGLFFWMDTYGHDIRRLVRSRSPFGNKLLGSAGEGRGRSPSVVPDESFLKGEGESICLTHLLDSPLSTLFTSTSLVGIFFLWGGKSSKICQEICHLHPSEGDLGVPSVKICQQALRITFLDQMCLQLYENGEF